MKKTKPKFNSSISSIFSAIYYLFGHYIVGWSHSKRTYLSPTGAKRGFRYATYDKRNPGKRYILSATPDYEDG